MRMRESEMARESTLACLYTFDMLITYLNEQQEMRRKEKERESVRVLERERERKCVRVREREKERVVRAQSRRA